MGTRLRRAPRFRQIIPRRPGAFASSGADLYIRRAVRRLSIFGVAVSGSQISSAALDARRRKILFRSWHRGMRETDLLMGRFADAEIGHLSEPELAEFEGLLEVSDRDILGWLTGGEEVPSSYDTPTLRKLKLFHAHAGPLDL
jgi:antitoxin CptB